MITTDFVNGSPCWLDLGAPDVDAAASFYSGVFDWEYQSFGPDAEGYGAFRKDGSTVGAVGKLTEEGARSAWMVYFRTDDAKAVAQQVESAGGALRGEPMDAGPWGTMAQLTDPQGGQFAVWQQGAESSGLERVDDTGSLGWIELYTPDAGGAKDFYRGLFGWQYEDMPMPGDDSMTYTLITPAGKEAERMHGGLMQMPADQLPQTGGKAYWHPVFGTDDCDATVARVRQHGGDLLMGPEDAEGVGRMAVCTDQNGAEFVVLKPAPMEG
ncbi:VOC family protein [Streptomyces sp. DSM 42041]|uniref:VOC family protein n=1 Tax=Streptomyces hazeniae TaxID=3075538 RepID=A0ABU2NZ10_9ACTN|nr:VOC family protein [Streptomyces sp. DSM 42041]MDT0381757.1 VOC family protein [Streptomyces sp. DSM 42041]